MDIIRENMKTLFEKYRSGRISLEEFESLSKSMDSAADSEIRSMFEQEWNDFTSDMPLSEDKKESLYPVVIGKSQRRSRYHIYISVAACLMFVFALGITLKFFDAREEIQSLSAKEVTVTAGSDGQSFVTLPDGSTVRLNVRSSISYNSDFSVSDRRVRVEGEAFFDVKKDGHTKFVVSSENMEITVHGTKFNVYAYPECDFAEMSLVEGSVTLRSGESEIKVAPNEKVCIDRCTGRMNLMQTDNEVETAWLKKTLTFMHEPLYKVIDKLERRFGVTIECSDSISLSDIYTGTFKDRSITDILDVLKIHYGFTYETDENVITIK